MRTRTFASILILAANACRNEPTAPGSAKGLTLTAAVTQAELQRGQPDTVTMTLTNTNPHPVTLGVGACEPLPYVRDATGATVVPSGGYWVCVLSLRTLRLSPGERYAKTFVWETAAFTPGAYSVHATFSAEGVRLETPPVSVRVN